MAAEPSRGIYIAGLCQVSGLLGAIRGLQNVSFKQLRRHARPALDSLALAGKAPGASLDLTGLTAIWAGIHLQLAASPTARRLR